ncbi:MAG TPA: 50S ribosomal protein L4 [Clostridiales bacterium]|jgi:large subunit ribosomal protein L4|nr:50S ribosomal protein L4 [Clostridiales bacterium]
MPTVSVVNMQGKPAGELTLNEEVFGIKPNQAAMHLVVRSILAAKRQGTQSALTRAMVRGGGRKIYRQKGTGRARHHSNRAPQFRTGGVVFAPQPRDYVVKVPRKVRRLAMKSALSAKLAAGDMIVLDGINLPEAKTRLMAKVLHDLGIEKSCLLVMPERDETIYRAGRNLPGLRDSSASNINVYDILRADKLVLTKDAVMAIQEVYAS